MDITCDTILFLLLNYLFLALTRAQTLNILAFEYTRNLQEIPNMELDIGQCAHYVEEISPGVPVVRQCFLPKVQGQKLDSAKNYVLNDTQNIEVKSASDIFTYVGLCDSKVVSELGLLHKGECVAIEIASMLSFNKKTYIRAYVEYYRHKVDILELENDFTALLTAGNERELYLKNRSIGTMEVVLVEMKFHKKKKAALLKKSRYQSLSMRDWFSHAKAVAGEPANTKIVRLSTAKRVMEVKKYKTGQLRAIEGALMRYEAEILETRTEIERGYTEPHLNYAFKPYHTQAANMRSTSDRIFWEQASLVEIDINKSKIRHKALDRKCKRNFLPSCKLMKPVKKNIRRLKRKFDEKRRIWSSLSDMRKRQLVETTRKQIDSFLQEQTKMNGQFKQWRKQQKALKKAERLRQKKLRKKQKKKKSKKANDTTMKAIYFLASTPPY